MGVRVSKFQGAADPISRSQPFISNFLRGSTAENSSNSSNAASSSAPCSAKEVTQPGSIAEPHLHSTQGDGHADGADHRDVSGDSAGRPVAVTAAELSTAVATAVSATTRDALELHVDEDDCGKLTDHQTRPLDDYYSNPMMSSQQILK